MIDLSNNEDPTASMSWLMDKKRDLIIKEYTESNIKRLYALVKSDIQEYLKIEELTYDSSTGQTQPPNKEDDKKDPGIIVSG